MHTLRNWTAKRSGPQMTVAGFNQDGKLEKVGVVSVQGPGSRVCAPNDTIGVMPNGDIIRLVA